MAMQESTRKIVIMSVFGLLLIAPIGILGAVNMNLRKANKTLREENEKLKTEQPKK